MAPTAPPRRGSATDSSASAAAMMLATQRGRPTSPQTSTSKRRFAQRIDPTPALIASAATRFDRAPRPATGSSSAISGATRTTSAIAGPSAAPEKMRAPTRASTTGEVQAATARAAEPPGMDSAEGARRRTTATSRTAASGAARTAYHQNRPTPASLRAPGFPGASISTSAPARRPSKPTTPTRRRAAIDIARL